MSREALVVLGAGLSQRPLIQRARSRGLVTCVVDGRNDRPGLADADVAIHQDFSDVAATAAALEAAGVTALGVCSMGSDHAVLPVASLAERLGLPGLPVAAARAATDKVLQRAAYRERDVPSAGYAPARDLQEALAAYDELGPRVVVKPTDGAAQRGVSEVGARDEVESALAHALAHARGGTAIVEEHLDGEEYTVNGFVLDGAFHAVTVTLRALAPPPAVGICTAHRYPCGRPAAEVAEIVDATARAAAAIGIDGAPVYAQLRYGSRGPRLIECGARLGGGGDAALARLVVGVDLIDVVLDAALGVLRDAALAPRAMPEPFGQTRFAIPPSPGRVVRAAPGDAPDLPGVRDVGFFHGAGRVVPPLWSASGRLGFVLVTAASDAELDARTDAALAALDVEIEPMGDDEAQAAWREQVARARAGEAA